MARVKKMKINRQNYSRKALVSGLFGAALALSCLTLGNSAGAALLPSAVAVVNGQVITSSEVFNRTRLLALSADLPISPAVINRLAPHVLSQMVNNTAEAEAAENAGIIIPTAMVEAAIARIATGIHSTPAELAAHLTAAGIPYDSFVNQIRDQLAWAGLLRELVRSRMMPDTAEIDRQIAYLQAHAGEPQYLIQQIFIRGVGAKQKQEAFAFADTLAAQLRGGAPFGLLAAQFSDGREALNGGYVGWVTGQNLDPNVAALVKEMPVGAVSEPLNVPGGVLIVALKGRHKLGAGTITLLNLREAVIPFASPLNPQNPTKEQLMIVRDAGTLSKTAKNCQQFVTEAREIPHAEVRLVNGLVLGRIPVTRLRDIIAALKPSEAGEPLLSPDSVGVIMVCSRRTENPNSPVEAQVAEEMLTRRMEIESRSLSDLLKRQAVISYPEKLPEYQAS